MRHDREDETYQLLFFHCGRSTELFIGKDANPFHLVKYRIVSGINLIAAIYITTAQKSIDTRADELTLMGGSMCSQKLEESEGDEIRDLLANQFVSQIVSVTAAPATMIWRDK
jgi:hypothetical protein